MRLLFTRPAAVLAILFAATSVHGQVLLQYPAEPPAQFLREAFDHPYGRAVLAEFARTVTRNAEAACLQTKGLDTSTLIERGRGIFQRYGTQGLEKITALVDTRLFDKKFAERAGRTGAAELNRLQSNRDVIQYMKLERPIRLAKILDTTVENFERYVLLNRIGLPSFSGIATGNDDLLRLNPTEPAEEAVEKFAAASKSRQLKRFIELSEMATEALVESFNREVAIMWGPRDYFGGVEKDLADICIVKR
jgi:hypothetical protein